MAGAEDIPVEADEIEGIAHPREHGLLFGQEAAEGRLLAAYQSGKMPHAWIIAGPQGVGKATLAYRLARFVLTHPDPAAPVVQAARTLAVDMDAPPARQLARRAHPDVVALSRTWNSERKTFYTEIRVDEARRARTFFNSGAGAGGWRVCIVDPADDLNHNAANALLKIIEEPPARTLVLLLAHRPGGMLATIRSRCRVERLGALDPQAVVDILSVPEISTLDIPPAALARAAGACGGSVRAALALLDGDAGAFKARIDAVLTALPRVDWKAAHAMADSVSKAGNAGLATFTSVVLDWLHARVVTSSAPPATLERHAALWDNTARLARETETYNLDKRVFVIATVSELSRLVSQAA